MRIFGKIILIGIIIGCNNSVDVDVPQFNDGSYLDSTLDLPSSAKTKMEGVYKVNKGNDVFGNRVVLKWSRNGLSIFGENQAIYSILDAGSLNNEIRMEGYWRYAVNTETGLTRFVIPSDKGGSDLLTDTSDVKQIIIIGNYGYDVDTPNLVADLEYERPFSKEVTDTDFYILAHRGGGRTADNLPASENSVEILKLTELLGGNAIEIDVKLSRDRVPFLYHDRTINLRLTRKSTIWGNIEDFTFPQLRSLITLIRGEKIPTLLEALIYVVEKTNIEFVWLDMKSIKNDIPEVIQIQKDILQRAENLGKKLEIYVGLPTDDKVEHFMSHPDWETTPSLNEFEPDDARRTKSEVWAPRWTLGMQNETVLQMQSEGRKVITWTMDDPAFIKEYMYEGHFNGMVTNYPTLVAYYHYSR